MKTRGKKNTELQFLLPSADDEKKKTQLKNNQHHIILYTGLVQLEIFFFSWEKIKKNIKKICVHQSNKLY